MSSDAKEWSVVLETVLQSVMGLGDCANEHQFPIEPVGSSLYLKFTALSFYGVAAGLNYIGVYKEHKVWQSGSINATVTDDTDESTETGEVSVTARQLLVGAQTVTGLRFTTIQIPEHAMIEHAYLEVFAAESSQGDSSITITAELSPSGSSTVLGATGGDLSSRPQTVASVQWRPEEPWLLRGQKHTSPDLVAIVGEVVGSEQWRPNDAITFELRGSGTRAIISSEGDLMAGGQHATLRVQFKSLLHNEGLQSTSQGSQEEDEGVVEDASLLGPKQLDDQIDFDSPAAK